MDPVSTSQSARAAARKHRRDEGAIGSLAAFLSMPGYLVRRSKQISTSIFAENCRQFAITPIQFAALTILRLRPAIDQTELGEIAALDPSTTGDVMARLERRSLVRRDEQGQRRVCNLTTQGALLLDQVTPRVAEAQRQLVGALTAREQGQLLRLLSKMNDVSNLHYTRRGRRPRRQRGVAALDHPRRQYP
jgi:MarR family transcriptional regulator, lower aerobic nicotinate degradation pathway regulator